MFKNVHNVKFPCTNLWPGLFIDTDDHDNNTRRIIHDNTGYLAFMPNEPIRTQILRKTIQYVDTFINTICIIFKDLKLLAAGVGEAPSHDTRPKTCNQASTCHHQGCY